MPDPLFDLALVGRNLTAYSLAHFAVTAGLSVGLIDLAPETPQPETTVIWVVKQAPAQLEAASNARAFYRELCDELDIPLLSKGSLLLAFQEEEMAVLEEFSAKASLLGYTLQLLTPEEVLRAHPAVSPVGLEGALLSPMEISFPLPLLLGRWREQLASKGVVFRRLPYSQKDPPSAAQLRPYLPAKRLLLCEPRLVQACLPGSLPPPDQQAGVSRSEYWMDAPVQGGYLLNTGWVETPVPAFELCESLSLLRPRLLKGCGCEASVLPAVEGGYYLSLSTLQHRLTEQFGQVCLQKVDKRLGKHPRHFRGLHQALVKPGLHCLPLDEGWEIVLAEGDVYQSLVPDLAKGLLSGQRPA